MALTTKSKRIIRVVIFFIFIIISINLFSKSEYTNTTPIKESSTSHNSNEEQIPRELIQADANQLISIVESTHPAFSLGDIPKVYTEAKQSFLSETFTKMTKDDFAWLARKYLTSLDDGHTTVFSNSEQLCLDVLWKFIGDKLYLLNSDGTLSDQQVIKIGGMPIQNVFQTVSKYFPAENASGIQRNNAQWSECISILSRSGISYGDGNIPISLKIGDETVTKKVGFVMKYLNFYNNMDVIASSKILGDVVYVKLAACETGSQLNDVIYQLKREMKRGMTKVIIDVRDNPGGDSTACKMLLEAMNMEPPQYGLYIRYSPLAQQQRSYPKQTGYDFYAPNINIAKRNTDISLIILTNENTYSSATMLGVWVQDGKLGKIIGKPSSNSPNCYGDVLQFQLTNTQLQGQISHKQWTRPDSTADPKMLQPDITSPFDVDSLQIALEYLDEHTLTID